MDTAPLEVIRIANREFREFSDRFSVAGMGLEQCLDASRRLGKVSLRLKQVERLIAQRLHTKQPEPGLDETLQEYGQNLKALKEIVENLESTLLARKTGMDNARARMNAADAWARSVRELS